MNNIKGFIHNPPNNACLLVGQLLINFGAVELISYQWLRHFSESEKAYDRHLKRLFTERANVIQAITRKLTINPELKAEIISSWNLAKDIAQLRNAVAHNPIVFVWQNKQEASGEPDLIGIPVMQYSTGEGLEVSPLVDLAKLNRSIDDIAELAQKLHGLFLDVQKVTALRV